MNKNLEQAYEKFTEDYASKSNTVSWFLAQFKTHLSKNITLEDWNSLQQNLKNIISDNVANKELLESLTKYLINDENVDSKPIGLLYDLYGSYFVAKVNYLNNYVMFLIYKNITPNSYKVTVWYENTLLYFENVETSTDVIQLLDSSTSSKNTYSDEKINELLNDKANQITLDKYYSELESMIKESRAEIETKSNLISIIGEATESLAGVMSADDKKNLDILVALLQDNNNDVVDTINEVLAIFNKYPEGVDLVNELSNKLDKPIEVTYSELKTLVNYSKLVPGAHYVLTDYSLKTGNTHVYTIKNEFTNITATAYASSVPHSFRILLKAVRNNALSEDAIILSNALEYIGESDWETGPWSYSQIAVAKYAIYNTQRFAWASDLCNKGVIYWMKDRYNNEASFDFYHIRFKRTSKEIFDVCNHTVSGDQWLWLFTDYRTSAPKMFVPLEFLKLASGDNIYLGLHDNIVKPRYENYEGSKSIIELPDVVFIESAGSTWGPKTSLTSDKYGFYGIFGNSIGVNAGHITIGSSCYSNIIGNNCVNVSIASFSHSNTIGHYFQQNTIGYECQSNVFGNHCQNNLILNRFKANNCENELSDGQFGNDIKFNNFGNRANALDLWDGCEYNQFAPFCRRVFLHGTCLSNTFNQDCFDLTLNGECNGNMFAADVNSQTFTNIKHKFIGFDTYSQSQIDAFVSEKVDKTTYESKVEELEGRIANAGGGMSEETYKEKYQEVLWIGSDEIPELPTDLLNEPAWSLNTIINAMIDYWTDIDKTKITNYGYNQVVFLAQDTTSKKLVKCRFIYNATDEMYTLVSDSSVYKDNVKECISLNTNKRYKLINDTYETLQEPSYFLEEIPYVIADEFGMVTLQEGDVDNNKTLSLSPSGIVLSSSDGYSTSLNNDGTIMTYAAGFSFEVFPEDLYMYLGAVDNSFVTITPSNIAGKDANGNEYDIMWKDLSQYFNFNTAETITLGHNDAQGSHQLLKNTIVNWNKNDELQQGDTIEIRCNTNQIAIQIINAPDIVDITFTNSTATGIPCMINRTRYQIDNQHYMGSFSNGYISLDTISNMNPVSDGDYLILTYDVYTDTLIIDFAYYGEI